MNRILLAIFLNFQISGAFASDCIPPPKGKNYETFKYESSDLVFEGQLSDYEFLSDDSKLKEDGWSYLEIVYKFESIKLIKGTLDTSEKYFVLKNKLKCSECNSMKIKDATEKMRGKKFRVFVLNIKGTFEANKCVEFMESLN